MNTPQMMWWQRPIDIFLGLSVVFFTILAVVCMQYGLLPPTSGVDAGVFFVLVFLGALYRPLWVFFLFIASVPLEIIDLMPVGAPLHLRPYQLLALCLALALIIRGVTRRLPVHMFRLHTFDVLVGLFILSGWATIFTALDPRVSLKQTLILTSYGLVYMLTRYFIRSASDSLRIVPYVVIAGGITSIYAIWQNLRFMAGKNAFEVMAGRPNATFAEADWLGMWLVLMGALLLTLLWRAERWTSWREAWSRRGVLWLGGWLLGVVMTMSLFLTVARSAWLAMILMALVFGTGLFVATLRGHISWPELFLKKSLLSSAVLVAGGLVYGLHLTNFPLWQRVQSTGGWQEITIACSMPEATLPPERIQNVQELDQYSCRHINLEEVDQERRQGQFITRVERPDPNVAVRASIYTQVWETLRQRPLQGIGWGNDGVILGEDARGASLNASNIFLEVWLGSGVIGLGIFVWLWGWIVWASLRVIQQGMDRDRQSLGWCMLFSWIGLTVANFFNAGILLGFLWVWLALGVVTVKSYAYRN